MPLTLAEKFLILIHHPEKSAYLISDQMRNVGLIGALLLDLAHEDKIVVEEGKMRANAVKAGLSSTHQEVFIHILAYGKARKIKSWISTLSGKSRHYRHEMLHTLEEKGVLRIESKRFLFFNYLKTYLLAQPLREELIKDLREVIFEGADVGNENVALLSLVEACKMYKVICKDRSEIKHCKSRLKELIQGDQIAQGVDKVIKAMQAAVIAAIVAVTAATTASTSAR